MGQVRRRQFLIAAGALLAAPLAAEAQPRGKVYRVGFLGINAPSAASGHIDALRHALRELGWVDGQNLLLEYRWAEGKLDRLPVLARELARLNVDAIVTSGAPAALATKQATSTIPIVMAQINDPVALGLVASLSKPGGNVTGLATLHSELSAKQVELLKEAVPSASRVGLLWNSANPGSERILQHTQHLVQKLGLALQHQDVRDPKTIAAAFAELSKLRTDVFLLLPDPMFFPYGKDIVALAAKYRLPAMYGWREFVEIGGLMAYEPNIAGLFRRAAFFVDKILKGTKPADLPVEQPTKFDLVINLKTAKALGITIPKSVLLRADRVIE